MKHLTYFSIILLLLAVECSSARQNNADMIQVKIMYTSDYCGGARPSEEILEELKSMKPFAEQEISIYTNENKRGNPLTIKTDSNGVFNTNIPKGKYFLFINDKLKIYENATESCKEWAKKPDIEFEITSGNIELQFHKKCNPCLPLRQ